MPRNLASLVDKVARASVGKDWSIYASLLQHWGEIVGDEYARITTPVKLTFPHQPLEPRRRGGTLTVRLPKGLAMEFTFKSDIIKQRINVYFGYDAVAKILLDSVRVMPKTKAKPAVTPDPALLEQLGRETETIENDELRNALVTFGAAFIKKEPR